MSCHNARLQLSQVPTMWFEPPPYLTFLEEPDDVTTSHHTHINHVDDDEEDFDDVSTFDHSASHKEEEKHVVVLKEEVQRSLVFSGVMLIQHKPPVRSLFNAPGCDDCCNRGQYKGACAFSCETLIHVLSRNKSGMEYEREGLKGKVINQVKNLYVEAGGKSAAKKDL
ncbi:unnamed protein product [Lupinus luteus]|uniref:Uncharacterized protein n=1 Tax=Lupinus luteus TaxID=3873 RepID=A0AAV1WW67_LUPLU